MDNGIFSGEANTTGKRYIQFNVASISGSVPRPGFVAKNADCQVPLFEKKG